MQKPWIKPCRNILGRTLLNHLKNQPEADQLLEEGRHFSLIVAVLGSWQPSNPALNSLSTQPTDSGRGILDAVEVVLSGIIGADEPEPTQEDSPPGDMIIILRLRTGRRNLREPKIQESTAVSGQSQIEPEFPKNGGFTKEIQTTTKRR